MPGFFLDVNLLSVSILSELGALANLHSLFLGKD
jgi:hypothetical protein